MRINGLNQDYTPVQETAKVEAKLPAGKKSVPAAVEDALLRKEQNASRKELEQAVDKMQQAVSIFNKHFKFNIHEKTHRVIVQVIDSRTNEVVNEIPPEKILDMVADLQNLVGVIIDKKA
ncbi:MAG TPA: flagellar protein FlaG [Bacillota bacterium]|nr:flagellar protein FlaG [Bacillota bacterium]